MRIPAVWFALLMMISAAPMVFRRVPPNAFYGFRTPKTQSSPEIWYEANYRAGMNILAAGAVTLLVTGAVAMREGARRANLAGMLVLIAMVMLSVGVSFVQLHRM